jgi:lipid A 3-O-deacylase
MSVSKSAIAAVLAVMVCTTPAMASEVYAGLYGHDVTFIGEALGTGAPGRESGTDLQLGWRSEPISALHLIWSPSSYAFVSLNSHGDTSFVSTGLAWKVGLGKSKQWYFRPGLGLAYQNGPANLPDFRVPGLSTAEQQRRADLRKTHIEFGSKFLFQPDLSLGRTLGNGDAVELNWTHISNGKILASGKNQGMDDVGVRYIHRLGGK